MPTVRAHVLISGRVQGVFFRDTSRQQARLLQLAGWVRNLPDGRVEAVFQGEAAAVQQMIDWSHQGPPRALVEEVEVSWEDPQSESGFYVR